MNKGWIIGGVVGVIVLVYLGGWLSILVPAQPLESPIASWPIWPIACGARGCITSARWLHHHQLAVAFSQATKEDTPAPEQTLTTKLRAHAASRSFLRSPVQAEDVARYREQVLHITTNEQLQTYMPTTLAEYDKTILTPFLQQEALRTQHSVESTEELYKVLFDERPIVLLLFQYQWNSDSGTVSAEH